MFILNIFKIFKSQIAYSEKLKKWKTNIMKWKTTNTSIWTLKMSKCSYASNLIKDKDKIALYLDLQSGRFKHLSKAYLLGKKIIIWSNWILNVISISRISIWVLGTSAKIGSRSLSSIIHLNYLTTIHKFPPLI